MLTIETGSYGGHDDGDGPVTQQGANPGAVGVPHLLEGQFVVHRILDDQDVGLLQHTSSGHPVPVQQVLRGPEKRGKKDERRKVKKRGREEERTERKEGEREKRREKRRGQQVKRGREKKEDRGEKSERRKDRTSREERRGHPEKRGREERGKEERERKETERIAGEERR